MKRAIEKELQDWKEAADRLPLIVRGARQVGKSYAIETFGRDHFSNLVVANFEENPLLATCFETLEIDRILRMLSHLTEQAIIPGKTLLFLDEIQNCLPAIKALRYFKEKAPSLHVIAAGSFLEFVLEDEPGISFPVGRVQFINMKPLSFLEFLEAMGKKGLIEILKSASLNNPLPESLHTHLLQHVRDFLFVGGMPGVVKKFLESNSFLDCQRIQSSILDFYHLDLAKYATKQQYKNLDMLFRRIPDFTGQHFKFSKIDPESTNPARDYKQALHKLELARLIHIVNASDANGAPLKAEMNSKKFKVFFLDLGLLQLALEVNPSDLVEELVGIHRGVLAEQLVAQELLAYVDPYFDRHLYFWDREKKGSTAEVDFLVNIAGQVIPIEVKAGKTGRLQSLKQFLALKGSRLGVKISEAPLSLHDNILSVPFYMISQLPGLIKDF